MIQATRATPIRAAANAAFQPKSSDDALIDTSESENRAQRPDDFSFWKLSASIARLKSLSGVVRSRNIGGGHVCLE